MKKLMKVCPLKSSNVGYVLGFLLVMLGISPVTSGASTSQGGSNSVVMVTNAMASASVSSNGETTIVFHVRVVPSSIDTNNSLPLISIRKDVWSATTTLVTVVHFDYGTNSQFKVEITPDMSLGSWRGLLPGELKGVTLSPTTNSVLWIEYWLDPQVIGTPARMARIFDNHSYTNTPPPQT